MYIRKNNLCIKYKKNTNLYKDKLFKIYLAFFKYRFFVFAWSDVNNKINIVPTRNVKIIVKPTTSTISLGR